jgi:hypothetical protein
MLRAKFGIKNRDGKNMDILRRFTFRDETGKRVIIKNGSKANMPLKYDGTKAPSVELTLKENGNYNLAFSGSDFDSVFTLAKRKLKQNQIPVSDEQLRICLQANGEWNWNSTKATSDITIAENNYIPCITKIAYEAACDFLGAQYAIDQCGEQMRQFLYNYSYDLAYKAPPRPNFRFKNDEVSEQHKMSFNRDKDNLHIHIQLFGGLQFSTLVSNTASHYDSVLFKNNET